MSEQADSQPQATGAEMVPEPAPQATEAAPQESGQPEYVQALMSRMDELQARLPEQQAQQEPTEDFNWDQLAYGQPEYEQPDAQDGFQEQPGYEDPQQGVAQLEEYINSRISEAVRSQVDPMRIQAQAQQLEQKYPDLAKPEVAGPLVKQAAQEAQRLGYNLGWSPEQVDRLARDPGWVEKMYLASLASQRATQETPAEAENGAHIEGTSAQVEQPEVSVQERIINAGGSKASDVW